MGSSEYNSQEKDELSTQFERSVALVRKYSSWYARTLMNIITGG